MHNKKILATVCLLVLCTTQANAKDTTKKHLLTYKFKMGEVMRYRVHHATDIRTTIEETTQQAESTSESIKAWKVTDVLPSGEMQFVHLVETVRMTNTVPNRGTTRFDSEADKTPPLGFEQAARAVGVPLSVIRIKPSGEIVHREEKHPQPASSNDMPITLRLPSKAIAIGEQWDATYDVDAQRKSKAKLKVRTRRVCTLKNVQAGIATIAVEYQILTPVSAYIESQLVQKLTKGTVRFDIDAGRTVSQKFDADRRVIGFSGKASSMHYVSRLEERLLKPGERLAQK
ncbi:MAG: hypothetical protein GXP24_00125 [Planctomycetes bacterium]|nr:hypothetical protein [Planctomycetota bacterium]